MPRPNPGKQLVGLARKLAELDLKERQLVLALVEEFTDSGDKPASKPRRRRKPVDDSSAIARNLSEA